MKLNRLVLDLLDWIRRFLWAQEGETPHPYQSLKAYEIPGVGTLKLVEGRDTPRALRTWIFSPANSTQSYYQVQVRPRDWHIYLDLIQTIPLKITKIKTLPRPKVQPPRKLVQSTRNRMSTHTITILRADPLPNKDTGNYAVTFLASIDRDFSYGGDANRNAQIACDRTAKLIASRFIKEYELERELDTVYKLTVGLPVEGREQTQAFKMFG